MTSKEQERKALAQIEKIVAGLGENSYIGMAMDGVLKDAAENIEYDFGNSWKERAATNEKVAADWKEKYETLKEKYGKECSDLKENAEYAEQRLKNAQERIDKYAATCADIKTQLLAHINTNAEQKAKIETLETEIMKLKAKLYDLMTQ